MRRAAATVALLAVAILVWTPPARGEHTMTARTFTRLLRSGPVELTGYRIRGTVRLAGSSVTHRLSCQRCVFDGGFVAPGATFGTIVDLRGSSIHGRTNLSQARFLGPTLAQATFAGGADFSLATFSSFVTFEKAIFIGAVDFSMTTFASDAVFAFGKSLVASCTHGPCAGGVTFARARFSSSTDFEYFVFFGKAAFDEAQFKGPADFGGAKFNGTASFDRTRFSQGATFIGAGFLRGSSTSELDDSFLGAVSNDDLSFAFATFQRPTDFENTIVDRTMSFSSATFGVTSGLHFSHVSVGAFLMSVRSALQAVEHDRVTDDRRQVLAMIESSAKAQNDLGLANDAHYASQVLKSDGYEFPHKQFDFVVYRLIAGYFVRPFNPLTALLVLAASMTLFRALSGKTGSAGAGFGTQLLGTLSLIGPAGGNPSEDRQSRQVEVLAYRVLFALVLVGLANSNPTFRQMLDAIHLP